MLVWRGVIASFFITWWWVDLLLVVLKTWDSCCSHWVRVSNMMAVGRSFTEENTLWGQSRAVYLIHTSRFQRFFIFIPSQGKSRKTTIRVWLLLLLYPPGKKGTCEDDFPFPKVGYVSFLAGNIPSHGLKPPTSPSFNLSRSPPRAFYTTICWWGDDEAGLNGTSKTARGYNHMTIQES